MEQHRATQYMVSGVFRIKAGECLARLWKPSGGTTSDGWLDLHIDGEHADLGTPLEPDKYAAKSSDGRFEGVAEKGRKNFVCVPALAGSMWKSGDVIENMPISDISRCGDKERLPVSIYFVRNDHVYDFTLFVRPGGIATSIKSGNPNLDL